MKVETGMTAVQVELLAGGPPVFNMKGETD